MTSPSDLIKLADQIDSRLGPISGRTADRIAVVLRNIAAERSGTMNNAVIIARLRSVAECHPDEPFGNLLRSAALNVERMTKALEEIRFIATTKSAMQQDYQRIDLILKQVHAAAHPATPEE